MPGFRSVLGAFVGLLLAGCVSSGVKVDQNKLAQLHPGATTFNEAVALLGKPNNSSIQSDGTRSITYVYFQSQANAANFIRYVGMFAGGASSENSTIVLNFDSRGILTTYSSNQGSNDVNTGIINGQRQ